LKTSNRNRCAVYRTPDSCARHTANGGDAVAVGVGRGFELIRVFHCILQQALPVLREPYLPQAALLLALSVGVANWREQMEIGARHLAVAHCKQHYLVLEDSLMQIAQGTQRWR
jgi:hypothetical protein